MFIGGAFLVTSFFGKLFIYAYRSVKLQDSAIKTAKGLTLGTYYKGGFRQPMTAREASLILGINATGNQERINHRHRKLMFLNHPDNGGSTYLASKINEAKEVLSK